MIHQKFTFIVLEVVFLKRMATFLVKFALFALGKGIFKKKMVLRQLGLTLCSLDFNFPRVSVIVSSFLAFLPPFLGILAQSFLLFTASSFSKCYFASPSPLTSTSFVFSSVFSSIKRIRLLFQTLRDQTQFSLANT